MDERERLERVIADTDKQIIHADQTLQDWITYKHRHVAELAALEEESDLSRWQPEDGESGWWIDIDCSIDKGECWRSTEPEDFNFFRTESEAEDALEYIRLCTRIHQMYVRLYGVGGWTPTIHCWYIRDIGCNPAVSAVKSNVVGDVTSRPFKTKEDAEKVIAQLKKEELI